MINIKPFRIKSKAVIITASIILASCNSVKQVASPSAIVITEVKQESTNPTVVVINPPTESLPPIAVDPPVETPKPVAPVCGTFNINTAIWSAYLVKFSNPSCQPHTCEFKRVDIGNGALNGTSGPVTVLNNSTATATINGDMNKTLTGNGVCGREYQVDAFCDGSQMTGAWGTVVKSDACPIPVIPPTPPVTPPVACVPTNNIVWGDWIKGSPVAGKATNVPCTKYNWHRDGKDSCGLTKSQDTQSCEKP